VNAVAQQFRSTNRVVGINGCSPFHATTSRSEAIILDPNARFQFDPIRVSKSNRGQNGKPILINSHVVGSYRRCLRRQQFHYESSCFGPYFLLVEHHMPQKNAIRRLCRDVQFRDLAKKKYSATFGMIFILLHQYLHPFFSVRVFTSNSGH